MRARAELPVHVADRGPVVHRVRAVVWVSVRGVRRSGAVLLQEHLHDVYPRQQRTGHVHDEFVRLPPLVTTVSYKHGSFLISIPQNIVQ